MKRIGCAHFVSLCLACALFAAGGVPEQARELERKGDAIGARQLLHNAARQAPRDAEVVLAYAEFLDRYHDPEARPNYEAALPLLDEARRTAVLRRLTALALLEGDFPAAKKYAQQAGIRLALPQPEVRTDDAERAINIPGPLASFARMAALAPDTKPADVLPALARNIITNGYQASSTGESLEPTEYMKLLTRYLSQARELQRFAGDSGTINIKSCESAETGELLRILGYRMRGGCGADVVLETVNATRAFLTIDSGFPIAELEQALRTSRPFTHTFKPTVIPLQFGVQSWLSEKEKQAEFIDTFLSDPALGRLYLALSKLDPETAAALEKAVPVQRLRVFAHVLDFFGGMFELRNGAAVVPGGERSAAAWAELAGAPPSQGAAFFEKLISRDDGWLASYYDALARVSGPVQEYLTEPNRLKRFYGALRGRVTSPGPARPVFRSNTDLMLMTTRLRLEPNGRPHIPGGLEVWKTLFTNHPHGKYDGKLTRAAASWKEPDDVLEALFALCRKAVDNEPLKIFMAVSDLNRFRSQPLAPATVDRLARDYRSYGAQYQLFAEAPSLKDQTIIAFLDAARAVTRTGDELHRANTAGTMQALAGLWQIFVRQHAIPEEQADAVLGQIVTPFQNVKNSRELFDAGRGGIRTLLAATKTREKAKPQEQMMDLLAGDPGSADPDVHTLIVQDMIRIFEAQRLVSLDTLMDLADNLDRAAKGEKPDAALFARLASRIQEIQLPRTGLTSAEKSTFASGYWTERHIDAQRKLNLKGALLRAGNDPEKVAELRGQLAPLLRDTLVGLNYVHYAPPGAQLLLTNPIFVRSHDFIGLQGGQSLWKYTEVLGGGWPAGGGGRLIGSLAGLPYALADAEQNFMVPAREQALIWGDLAPQMILAAKVPRWWRATPAQMHWVGLHMRFAESLLAEAVIDPSRRPVLVGLLEARTVPARARAVARKLEAGDVPGAIENVTPAEMFAIARDAVESGKFSGDPIAQRIKALRDERAPGVSYEAISRTFGTPKPTLTNSYRPELLYLRTFPALMGYSSRIMAESWESNALYWADVADCLHLNPAQLNLLIPEWTQKTVEKIFATHLEDWPALLRSMRGVGEEARLRMRLQMGGEQKASLED